jgi:NADH:ubiquinone oxidoreductase subunit F (NADH-binding)
MTPAEILALATMVERFAGLAVTGVQELKAVISGASTKDLNTILADADTEYDAIIADAKTVATATRVK